MWETWVRSLGWEDALEKEWLPTPVFWPGDFLGLYSPWGHKESDTTQWLSLSLFKLKLIMKMKTRMAERRTVHFKKLPVARLAKFAKTIPVWRRKCIGVESMQAPCLVSCIFFFLTDSHCSANLRVLFWNESSTWTSARLCLRTCYSNGITQETWIRTKTELDTCVMQKWVMIQLLAAQCGS